MVGQPLWGPVIPREKYGGDQEDVWEVLRSPGTSALVCLDLSSPHPCTGKFLALGSSLILHILLQLHEIKEDIPSLLYSWSLYLPPGFSEILPLLYRSHMVNRKIVLIYKLGSNSVTDVDLHSHLDSLRALRLLWNCDGLSWCGRVRTLGVTCLAQSKVSYSRTLLGSLLSTLTHMIRAYPATTAVVSVSSTKWSATWGRSY